MCPRGPSGWFWRTALKTHHRQREIAQIRRRGVVSVAKPGTCPWPLARSSIQMPRRSCAASSISLWSGLRRHELGSQCSCLCFTQSAVGNDHIETAVEHYAWSKDHGTVPGERRADPWVVTHPDEPGLACLGRGWRRNDDRRRPADSRSGREVGDPGNPRRHAAMHLVLAPVLRGEHLYVVAGGEPPEETAIATARPTLAARRIELGAGVGTQHGIEDQFPLLLVDGGPTDRSLLP